MVAASCASGTTVLTGAEELRVKESDRIQAMVDGLSAMGVTIKGTQDGAIIEGMGPDNSFSAASIVTHHDHRIAMAFTIAALRSSEPLKILNCAHVATSFPNFVELATKVGISLAEEFDS